MSRKSKKMVPTAADESAVAETTSETETTTIGAESGDAPPVKPGRGKKKAAPEKDESLLKRLVRLEKWARKVCHVVPTIPRHEVIDDDIEGT